MPYFITITLNLQRSRYQTLSMIDVDISQNKGISEKRLSKKKYLDILKLYTSKDFNARFSLDKIKKS